MIYADFEGILVPEDNGKQNPDNSYTNKHQNYVGWSYNYNLVCVDDQFGEPFKSRLCIIPGVQQRGKECGERGE